MNDIWKDVSTDYDRDEGGEQWIRTLDDTCWISVLHRRTGFGYMEWETALVFLHEVEGRKPTLSDRDCLMIRGDHRDALAEMPKGKLREWYAANIEGNKNSAKAFLDLCREAGL